MTERIITDRRYSIGQGYEMTMLVDMAGGHRVQVVVCQGNVDGSSWARVDRWDRTQWHNVLTLRSEEIGSGPCYVAWPWRRSDPAYRTALAHREDCEDWLVSAARIALAYAEAVLS